MVSRLPDPQASGALSDRMHRVFISVGSNLGEKLENCRKGIDSLADGGNCEISRSSRFYRTEPVDYLDQDWFVNAAIEIRTELTPGQLYEKLKQIESVAGRKQQTIRFGPRLLDMDILLYGAHIIDSETLVIPHPRMHKRRFVLKPVCDIDPHVTHPVLNRTMGQLLDALDETSQTVVPIP